MNKKMMMAALTTLGGLAILGEPHPFGPVVKKKYYRTEPETEPVFKAGSDPWVPFDSIPMDDPNVQRVRIDTRDYHCLVFDTVDKYPDTFKARKKPEWYFHSTEEVIAWVSRVRDEASFTRETADGTKETDYVMLALEGVLRAMEGQLKYTELIRMSQGWAICTGDLRLPLFMFHKTDLAQPVFYGNKSKA